MFGGILDDLKSLGDDPLNFFDTVLGQGVAKGFAAGDTKAEQEKKNPKQWFNEDLGTRQNEDLRPDMSENFNEIEYQWMKRLQRFSGLNDVARSSEVKLGGA